MPKTSYSVEWQDDFPWIKNPKHPESAYCELCMRSFRIDGREIAQVKSHRKSKSYSLKETARDGKTSQSVFAHSQGKLKVTHELLF